MLAVLTLIRPNWYRIRTEEEGEQNKRGQTYKKAKVQQKLGKDRIVAVKGERQYQPWQVKPHLV
jgi:hypothetical protein